MRVMARLAFCADKKKRTLYVMVAVTQLINTALESNANLVGAVTLSLKQWTAILSDAVKVLNSTRGLQERIYHDARVASFALVGHLSCYVRNNRTELVDSLQQKLTDLSDLDVVLRLLPSNIFRSNVEDCLLRRNQSSDLPRDVLLQHVADLMSRQVIHDSRANLPFYLNRQHIDLIDRMEDSTATPSALFDIMRRLCNR